jgi:hypothetical protein
VPFSKHLYSLTTESSLFSKRKNMKALLTSVALVATMTTSAIANSATHYNPFTPAPFYGTTGTTWWEGDVGVLPGICHFTKNEAGDMDYDWPTETFTTTKHATVEMKVRRSASVVLEGAEPSYLSNPNNDGVIHLVDRNSGGWNHANIDYNYVGSNPSAYQTSVSSTRNISGKVTATVDVDRVTVDVEDSRAQVLTWKIGGTATWRDGEPHDLADNENAVVPHSITCVQ